MIKLVQQALKVTQLAARYYGLENNTTVIELICHSLGCVNVPFLHRHKYLVRNVGPDHNLKPQKMAIQSP